MLHSQEEVVDQWINNSGDIKMLVSTQRSGTAADKVSAFAVLVGDNQLLTWGLLMLFWVSSILTFLGFWLAFVVNDMLFILSLSYNACIYIGFLSWSVYRNVSFSRWFVGWFVGRSVFTLVYILFVLLVCALELSLWWSSLFILGMVTSKVGKRHALTGFEALQELFLARSAFTIVHPSGIGRNVWSRGIVTILFVHDQNY